MSQLFRQEVAAYSRSRLHGEIHLFNSTSWNLVFYSVLGVLIILGIVGVTLPFSQVVMVRALVMPEGGVATITASRAGVLEHLSGRQGDLVRRGAVVATLDASQSLTSGESSGQQVASALKRQMIETERKLKSVREQVALDTSRLGQRMDLLSSDALALRQQTQLQESIVTQAQSALTRAETLSASGYVTRTYVDNAREGLLTKMQRLSELKMALRLKRQESQDAVLARRSALLSGRDLAANSRIERDELAQRLSNNSLSGSYAVTAPTTGLIGNTRFRVGQYVEAGAGIADIVPLDGPFVLELQAPTSAITSISIGQEVRIAFDAMPSQIFGTMRATISRVSSTTTVKQNVPPYYTVVAVIDRARTKPALLRALRPDLTGTAAIVQNRRTILDWCLQPFLQR